MKLKVAVAASFISLVISGGFANPGCAKSPLSRLLRWDSNSLAEPTGFQNSASYQLCFVPDGASCQDLLVSTIDRTQSKLRVQAYSFTSAPIAAAIKRAKDRGVDVKVILDKSQVSQRYSG